SRDRSDLRHARPGDLAPQSDAQFPGARLRDPAGPVLRLHDAHHAGPAGVQAHAPRPQLRPRRPAPPGPAVAQARPAARPTEQAGPRDAVERPPIDGPAAVDERPRDARPRRSRLVPGACRLAAPGAGGDAPEARRGAPPARPDPEPKAGDAA